MNISLMQDQPEFHLVLTQKFLTWKEPLCQEAEMWIRNNYTFPFYFFLRLIQESDPLQFLSCFQKHPGRCSFSIEKHMGDGNSGQPSAEGQSFQQCSRSPGGFSVCGEHIKCGCHQNVTGTQKPLQIQRSTEDEATT